MKNLLKYSAVFALAALLFIGISTKAQTIPSISPWLVDALGNITQRVTGTPVKINGNLTVTGTCTGCGSGSGSTLITAGTGISTTTSTGGAILVTNTGVTSLIAGTNISLSGSTGAVTITGTGLSTTSPIASSNLLEYSSVGAGAAFGVATSTLTASSPLTGSFTQIGSGGSLGCQTASGSQAGCLASADWTTFNNKLSSAITALGPTGQTQTGATQLLATSTTAFNGLTDNLVITGSGNTQTFSTSFSGTLGNAGLTNSTISGVALGGTLNTLSATNSTLTFSGSYTGTANQTVGLNLSNPNTWLALQTFGNSSTTLASFNYASSTVYFGAGLSNCSGATNALTWNLGQFGCNTLSSSGTPGGTSGQVQYNASGSFGGVASTSVTNGTGIGFTGTAGALLGGSNLTITNTGLLSLQQLGGGTAQTGAITFATTTDTFQGLTFAENITNSAGAFTFANAVSGTLAVGGGGTGDATFTSGQLLYGNGTNNLSSVATSSASCSSGVSCSSFTVVGTVSPSITNTGVTSITGTTGISCSGTGAATCGLIVPVTLANGGTGTTTGQSGRVLYVGGGSAYQDVATSSLAGGTNITITNGSTAFVLGAQPTISLSGTIAYANGGTGSTTAPVSQLLYGGATAYQSVSTSSVSAGIGVAFTGTPGALVGGTALTVGLNTNAYTTNQIMFYNGTEPVTASTTIVNNLLGTIGIGTTTPQWPLEIASSTKSQLALSDGSITDAQWAFRNAGGSLFIGTTSPTTYATNTPSAIQITSQTSTQLGVGTTTPWRTLSVTGTVGFDGLTTTSAAAAGTICITANKEIINESLTCSTSAERFKDGIEPFSTDALGELNKLQVVTYYYKSDYLGNYTDNPNFNGEHIGFVADQLQKIDPRLVSVEVGTTTFEGISYPAGTVHGLNDEQLIALNTKAIQELYGLQVSAKTNWKVWALFLVFGIWNLYLTFRKKI